MKWWQQILVDLFTNTYFNVVFSFVVFIGVMHFLGYHPEVWLTQFMEWITNTDPANFFDLF